MKNIGKKHINKLEGVISVFFISLLTVIAYIVIKTPNVIFIANMLMLLLILIKAKFSFFSMKAVIINYILVAVFFQFTTGKSYGILESSTIDLHYFEMNILIYLYNVINYICISYTKILNNEKELLRENHNIKKFSTCFCCVVAIVTAIIAFPGIPFDSNYISIRFEGLLPGNAWNHVSIVCLLFLLPNFKKSNVVKATYAFVIFWFISHYERVDIIGLLLFCLVYILARKDRVKLKTYIIVALVGILIVFTMLYIGEARVNNSKSTTIVEILKKTIVQNTAADIGYVFNSSIEFAKNEQLLKGSTYVSYVVELLPFTEYDIRCDKILGEKYSTPGGEFILSEPIMNFGFIGVIIFQIIEFSIYTLILSKKSRYRFLLYTFLMMTVFRTTWYGWVYIEKAIVYFIPIMYFITKFLDSIELKRNQIRKNNYENKINEEIKVLFYSEKWTSGGIEAFIMNVYRNLNSTIIKADILTSQNETEIYDEEIEKMGGEKYTTLDKQYNSPILRTLKNFTKFRQKIKEKNYDIIHLHICHGVAMYYAYLAKKAGIKYVILHSHNTNIGNKNKTIKNFAHTVCKNLFEKYADEYLACSDLAAEWLYTKKTISSGKVKIVNNAIDVNKFTFNEEEREKFRRELNINNKFVIGHIGRFSEQKNHEYLVEIFKEINNIDKESVLLLVGEGELKQNIIDKVNNLGLTKNVIFYGLTKEVYRVLWGMDVFVLPSLFEGKPVVGIETQAAALKNYMSDTITKTIKISEYVEYMSIQDEPKKWAEEIIKTGKKYERRNMYDTMLENNYDIKGVADEMEKLYITIVQSEKYKSL